MNATTAAARSTSPEPLLDADETAAFCITREDAASDFVIVCDHAGALLPRSLGSLGLSANELDGALASDVGAARVALLLGERLDACVITQPYSRAVIDCDHAPDAEAIPRHSEWETIAGNERLTPGAIAARVAQVHAPYHAAIERVLDQRQRDRRRTILLSLASFAPEWRGEARRWHLDLRFGADARLARVALKLLLRDERLVIGENEATQLPDAAPYTLREHGEGRSLAHLGIALRLDQVSDEAGQKNWAGRLASLLKQAGAALPA